MEKYKKILIGLSIIIGVGFNLGGIYYGYSIHTKFKAVENLQIKVTKKLNKLEKKFKKIEKKLEKIWRL